MTADGTQITTAAELDALPVGSVVRDNVGDAGLVDEPGMIRYAEAIGMVSAYVVKHYAPLTVLYRPDAPQPTPVPADAVERAARAMFDVKSDGGDEAWDEVHPNVQEHYLALARAALAPARAGEAERVYPSVECPGQFVGWSAFGATYPDTVCATACTWPEGSNPGPVLCDADDEFRPRDIPCPACDPRGFAEYEGDPEAPLAVYRLIGLLPARAAGDGAEVDGWAERVADLLPEDYAVDDDPRRVIEAAIPRLLAELGAQFDRGLAARGDAVAPAVTAEQVVEAANVLWEHQTGYRRETAPPSARADRQRQVRRVLAALGIEVQP